MKEIEWIWCVLVILSCVQLFFVSSSDLYKIELQQNEKNKKLLMIISPDDTLICLRSNKAHPHQLQSRRFLGGDFHCTMLRNYLVENEEQEDLCV